MSTIASKSTAKTLKVFRKGIVYMGGVNPLAHRLEQGDEIARAVFSTRLLSDRDRVAHPSFFDQQARGILDRQQQAEKRSQDCDSSSRT
ncbi:MAG: hypothetical protein AAGA60_16955 [Cyanobacteria bacterium P01_E01_bin.42]